MQEFDWSKFSLKIYIDAPMQQVHEAWTTRRNLEKWFLRKAEFTNASGMVRHEDSLIRVGDNYEWMWHGHPDTTVEHGTIIENNENDFLRFSFGKAGIVSVNLKAVEGLTEMILTQENIPTDDKSRANYHVGCSTGWTFYFANLKSILEGGIDLRNKNPKLTNVINS